jgi:hypothetical protein
MGYQHDQHKSYFGDTLFPKMPHRPCLIATTHIERCDKKKVIFVTEQNSKDAIYFAIMSTHQGLPDGMFSYQKPVAIWVYFGGLWNGTCWYIL